ncbi:MAG: DUF456 domain-containing protein [Pirellulales bacterium]|nr:DUF456 domain-containing protein [Pirellulales bacterium]
MSFLWAFLLVVVLLAAWMLTLLGVPGNWLIVAAVIVYVLFVPPESPRAIDWTSVFVLVVLATVGELLEFVAGALGVTKAGGSHRGAILALLGSLAGGIIGLFIGLPIPVVGSLLGAVLLAGVGAFTGAVLGEQWKGRGLDDSLRIGHAAFWGRLFGTVAKTALGAAMIATTIVALII